LNAQNIIKIKNAGLKIFPWTVNDPNAIAQMINFGVDGIITDFPERVHKEINISLE
jgi:glycerophosphoryl diester phosphodiesterase